MNTRSTAVLLLAAIAPSCFYNPEVPHSAGSTEAITTDATATSDPTSTTDGTAVCGDGKTEGTEQCDDGNDVSGDGCENDCTTTPGIDCGNGMLDPGEECDDGNDVAMDGCENNCTETEISANCGDGMVNGDDECDDGNTDNTYACTNTCKNAACGDGVVQAGVEDCDDDEPSATCDGDCTLAECGDGLVNEEADEDCEDMNSDATDACVSCKQASCGDGFVQAGVEECDDGTPDGDDLCNNCKIIPSRYIFITSSVFTGDRNGIAGADGDCVEAANAGSIPGAGDVAWTAWLSSATNQAVERLDTTFTGWYVLPTDPPTLVAKGWDGLTSGQLVHPIDHTETGEALGDPLTAWTNSDVTGALPALNLHCMNWNSMEPGALGRVGVATASDQSWTDPAEPPSAPCSSSHHLYCIQNVP